MEFSTPFFKFLKVNLGLGERRSKLLIPLAIILKTFIFQIFQALYSTCSCLHHRLQNSCTEPAISLRHLLKSISEGNLYLGPLHIIDRILESVIFFKSPVIV